MKLLLLLPLTALSALTLVSCESIKNDHPQPEREQLSSMPHNMPASWEGQQGMPGMPTQGF